MSIIRQLDQLADRAANNETNNRPDFKRNMKINIVRPTFVEFTILSYKAQINTLLKITFLRILTF